MATVVRGARATNSGMNSNRLKVDMGNLYELEDSQGALYVTGNVLGGGRAKSYEVRWQTDELRPKFDAVNNGGGYSSGATSIVVDNIKYFQIGDLIKVTRTGEVLYVSAVTDGSSTLTVTRSWGATAAAAITDDDEILIIGPHYDENAQLQSARTTTEVDYTNQTAIWRHNFEVSGTHQAIANAGGHFHGSDVAYQRKKMLLEHKRDINLACLFSESGSSGTRRSMMGMIEFIKTYGVGRVNSTSAVTFSVFMTAAKTATRFNNKRMVVICSRQFAQIVTEWGLANNVHIHLEVGAKSFGLDVMKITTPHGTFSLLVDDALEGTEYSQYAICVATDEKGGPKWKWLRQTTLMKDRQEDDQDGYEEEVLTEGTMELGNPQYHYLFDNANTSS